MRGIGGPLLCIGDLLSDVGEEEAQEGDPNPNHRENPPFSSSPSPSPSDLKTNSPPDPLPDLTKLFQDNYDQLNSALAGTTDHSWTSLTLKLCTALETANQVVQCTNSNVTSLLEKVEELQKIVKRGDSAIASAKTVYVSLDKQSGASK